MNKKGIILLIILLSSVVLYPIAVSLNISNSSSVKIDTWNINRHDGFPGITLAANGNFVVSFINSTSHSIGHTTYCTISSDQGVTWGKEFQILNKGGNLALETATADGTIYATIDDTSVPGAGYMLSYDNGLTWTSKGRISNTVQVDGARGGTVRGNIIYLCGYGYSSGPCKLYFLKSTNNCSSFQVVCSDVSPSVGHLEEWDVICINDTHFVGMCRYDTGTDYSHTYKVETWNAGVSWTTTDLGSTYGWMHDNHLVWLSEDKILWVGRNYYGYGYKSCYYVSGDYGATWQNYTVVVDGGYDPTGDGGYSQVLGFPDEHKAFVVTYSGYEQHPSFIYSYWVYDNAPIPDPGEEQIEFISIDGGVNNSVVYVPVKDFNWTIIDGATYYQLQVANDSAFTDVFIDIDDINTANYPGYYFETSEKVRFFLPEVYQKSYIGDYYYRVRPLVYH